MKRTIWKYRVPVGETVLDVPLCATPLSFGWKFGEGLAIWMSVDENEERRMKLPIQIIGTGWEPEVIKGNHLGTAITPNGLVWHAFVGTEYYE